MIDTYRYQYPVLVVSEEGRMQNQIPNSMSGTTSTSSHELQLQQVPPQLQLVYQRTYDPVTKKYCNNWEILHHRPDAATSPIIVPLERGGIVTIYPNLIEKENRDVITKEILHFRYPLTEPEDHTATRKTNHKMSIESTTNDNLCLSLFRQYHVQACSEPRLNCLLHSNATRTSIGTDNASSLQPGYRYGTVTMKARSYDNLPHTLRFTKQMELLYSETQSDSNASSLINTNIHNGNKTSKTEESIFNIGAHVVLYRDAHDSMGFHADNDQGESYILTTIVSQNHIRSIVVKPKPFRTNQNSESVLVMETHYKFELSEGDAYSMDGTMQENYLHGVPKNNRDIKAVNTLQQQEQTIDKLNTDESVFSYCAQYQRLVIVFRRGKYQEYKKDSGRSISHEVLQQTAYHIRSKRGITFGAIPDELIEGSIYSRRQLLDIGAHRLYQRSVSGNQREGCNAIIVSGLRHDCYSDDTYDQLTFCATSKEGGRSLLTSQINDLPIRVFRSSNYNSIYRANNDKINTCYCSRCRSNGFVTKQLPKRNVYRYDGLYKIINVTTPQIFSIKTPLFVFDMIKLWES